MLRFRELKEKDLVLEKLQKQDFEQRNLETIRDFDAAKQRDYVILMQENNFFNRNSYLALLERAHNKLVGKKHPQGQDLQLKIDHFFHSQSQKMVEEQLKYLCMAVRAEDCLREHLAF